MPRLTVNPDTADAWEITLRPGTNLFGRGETNDFPIEHPSVSNPHCEIVVMKSGVLLKDLGSANGSLINETPVNESLILPGQAFRLGHVWMRLEMDAQSPLINPAPNPAAPAVPGNFCKTHPKAVGTYYCPACKEFFCELCVVTRMVQGQTTRFCRACRGECVAMQSEETGEQPIFAAELPGAFTFPFQEDGLLVLIGGTIFYSLLSFFRHFLFIGGIVVGITGTGYLVAYLQSVIQVSALGKNRAPGWPDLTDWTDFLGPFWQSLCVSIFSFGPALVLQFTLFHYAFTLRTDPPPWISWVLPICIVWGCLYYPMGFLAVTMFDNIGALNPMLIIPSIFRIFWAYSLAMVLCGIIYFANDRGTDLFAMIFPVPIIGTLIIKFIGLYLAMVAARIMGLLYWTKKAELGWFRH